MELKPSTNTKITLIEGTKQLRVYAGLDPNIMDNILSHQVWEEWGTPSLRPLDPHLKETFIGQLSIGSFIVKIRIYDSMQCCLFYVAKKNKVQQGAIVSMHWMMKTKPLFTAESHTPSEVTAQVIMPMEPKKVAKLGDVLVTTPKLQNTASRERPSQVSTFKLDAGQLPQPKPKPSLDHLFI